MNLGLDSWGFALLLGGFVYFDQAGATIRVNVLTFNYSPTGMLLIGPYRSCEPVFSALREQDRVHEVTAHGLRAGGFEEFAWVHPSETTSAGPLTIEKEHSYEHGAFIYQLRVGGALQHVFYALRPLIGNAKQRAAALRRASSLSRDYDGGSVMGTLREGSLREGFRVVHVQSTKVAGVLQTHMAARALENDHLGRWLKVLPAPFHMVTNWKVELDYLARKASGQVRLRDRAYRFLASPVSSRTATTFSYATFKLQPSPTRSHAPAPV
jgi:hypothetical protein